MLATYSRDNRPVELSPAAGMPRPLSAMALVFRTLPPCGATTASGIRHRRTEITQGLLQCGDIKESVEQEILQILSALLLRAALDAPDLNCQLVVGFSGRVLICSDRCGTTYSADNLDDYSGFLKRGVGR